MVPLGKSSCFLREGKTGGGGRQGRGEREGGDFFCFSLSIG